MFTSKDTGINLTLGLTGAWNGDRWTEVKFDDPAGAGKFVRAAAVNVAVNVRGKQNDPAVDTRVSVFVHKDTVISVYDVLGPKLAPDNVLWDESIIEVARTTEVGVNVKVAVDTNEAKTRVAVNVNAKRVLETKYIDVLLAMKPNDQVAVRATYFADTLLKWNQAHFLGTNGNSKSLKFVNTQKGFSPFQYDNKKVLPGMNVNFGWEFVPLTRAGGDNEPEVPKMAIPDVPDE